MAKSSPFHGEYSGFDSRPQYQPDNLKKDVRPTSVTRFKTGVFMGEW